MKRINLLALLIAFTSLLFAQQVTNSGFDQIEPDEQNGVGERPTGWCASNVYRVVLGISSQGGDLICGDNNGRTGKCIHLQSKNVGAAGITEPAPAWITLGKPWNYLSGTDVQSATAGTDGGINFKYRPDTLVVWIKRTYSQAEDANIVVYSWSGTSRGDGYKNKKGGCGAGSHYDEESDIRMAFDPNSCGTAVPAKQIAEGHWRSNEQYPDWTKIEVPITYLNNDVPEKMNIIISASNYPNQRSSNIKSGAHLWVDDLSFKYSSAVHEVLINNRLMAGFDPAQRNFTYALGANADKVPTITLKRSGRMLDPQEYTIAYGAIGEDTRIEVRAEDGSSNTVYTIKFVGEVSKNPRPAGISVGGVPVPNFNAYVQNYQVELPYGTTSCPDITVDVAEAGQTFVVNKPSSLPGVATVEVTAPDASTKITYTLNLTVGALTDNTLTGITVNGKPIAGFKPTQNTYRVELPTGTIGDPVIEYTTAYPDEHVIVVNNNGISGGATISVTPRGSTLTRVYRLTFVVTESTYSYLQSLLVGGKELDGFAPEKLEYTVNLPLGTSEMPEITWQKGDERQTVTTDLGGLNGVTKVMVTAEAGNISIYRLTFVTVQSSVSTLAGIMLDGKPLSGFEANKFSYKVSLPIGTSNAPVVTYTQGDAAQTVKVIDGGLSGTTRIVVTAQDGSVSTYSITYEVKQASNSTLNDIKVGGISIVGFAPDVTNYTVVLPRGTVTVPEVTWETADEFQTVRMIAGTIGGEARIIVKAQTGATTTYVIKFVVESNSNVNLLGISVGGVAIENFSSDTLNYTYMLPSGTTVLPAIAYTKAEESQQVFITPGGVNGITSILVVAEDGTQRTYTIEFSVAKSENAFLNMVYVDGKELVGFEPNKLEYEYVIDKSTLQCPDIKVDKGAAGQSVAIITPARTGVVRIEVVPETGGKNVYTIDVHYPVNQSDAYVAGITINNQVLPGFKQDSADYYVTLPSGITQLPTIDVVAKYPESQQIYISKGGFNGVTKIHVRSVSGVTFEYRLHISVEKSAEALLKDIKIDGVSINGFRSDSLSYRYILSADKVKTPVISFTPANAHQVVQVSAPKFDGRAQVTVFAPDNSDTTVYTIDYVKELSADASLAEVAVNGEPIAFEGDTAHIVIEPDAAMPVVTFKKSFERQFVAVAEKAHSGAELLVVAEDGTQRRYVIVYDKRASSEASLAGIKLYVDGKWVELPGFAPTTRDYEYVLPWRTQYVPAVNPILANRGQQVRVDYGRVGGITTITVLAEDTVSKGVYTIRFVNEKSSEASLSAIYVDGNALPGFDADKTDYEIVLPAGTLDMPQISWDNALDLSGLPIYEQRVEYVSSRLDTVSAIRVVAEDGVTTQTYHLTFKVEANTAKNQLNAILLDGKGIENFNPDAKSYTYQMPYGAIDVPEIEVLKMYDEQRVIVSYVGGVDGMAEVKVLANDEKHSETIYTIDLVESTVSPLRLVSATVDGVDFPIIDGQTSYIVEVNDSKPKISAVPAQGCQIERGVSTDNYQEIKVFDLSSEAEEVYTFYFHYAGDVVPNMDFNSWGKAKYNNADKPMGWTVPADVFEKYKIVSTYISGKEVKFIERDAVNGRGVKLGTVWDGDNTWSISGTIPGMITTGDMTIIPAGGGKTTSSVSGGIRFRNTPDKVTLDYMPVANNNINNWRLLVVLGSGATLDSSLFDGNYDVKNQWQKAEQAISYGSLTNVNTMNVIINSAWTENANQLGGTAISHSTSELHVDNLAFEYSRLLKSIAINGEEIAGFAPGIDTYTVQLPADFQGRPQVTCVGEVRDQAHKITLSTMGNGYSADIVVTGEDGQQQLYTVSMNRDKSSNAALADIVLGKKSISDFDPSQTEYEVEVASLNVLPMVVAVGGSCHQSIATRIGADGSVFIDVKAEDGVATQTYHVSFVKTKSDDVSLKALDVEGKIEFEADKYVYNVDLAYEEVMPKLTFKKVCDGQVVTANADYDRYTVNVVSESGKYDTAYVINFTHKPLASASTLDYLSVNQMPLSGFASSVYDYVYDNTANDTLAWSFAPTTSVDSISQFISSDSVVISVIGNITNTYRVKVTSKSVVSIDLQTIKVDDVELPTFSGKVYDYVEEIDKSVYAVVKTSVAEGVMLSVSSEGYRHFAFSASDGAGEHQTTNIRFNTKKSNNAELSAIYLDGEPLVAEKVGKYTSSSAFDAELTDYVITLHSASPKLERPAIPAVSAVGGYEGQVISIVRQDYTTPTQIKVTSEAGTENIYSLLFQDTKSSEARLEDVAIDYVPLSEFNPDVFEYDISLPLGSQTPVVSYNKKDVFQDVKMVTAGDKTELIVTAEDGKSTAHYIFNFEVVRSSDAKLHSIKLDGVPVKDFNPDTLEYYFDLPQGTKVVPEVSVVAGHDGQQITISDGGINGITKVTVTAEDGITKVEYLLHFSRLKSENALLNMINVNGEPLQLLGNGYTSSAAFSADVFEYTITLPVGTTIYPNISWIAGDEFQKITSEGDVKNGAVIITVNAEKPGIRSVYKINVVKLKSDNALLKSLLVDGEEVENFTPQRMDYRVVLPVGTEVVPTVDIILGDEWQKATVSQAKSVNDTAYVVVMAEDTTVTRTYQVEFERTKSSLSTLRSISVGNMPIDGFHPDTLVYSYVLPIGTKTLPKVTYDKGDKYQTVDTISNGLNGSYIIKVTAESGVATSYVINFSVEESHNALLSNLMVDGKNINGFDPEIYSYEVYLPYGTTSVPVVTYTLQEPDLQKATIQPAMSLSDTVRVKVVAQDDTTYREYRVSFVIMKSNNAMLADIFVGGESVSVDAKGFVSDRNFAPDEFTYNITLPYGTDVLPAITWKGQVEDYYSIQLQEGGVSSKSVITVVSQDENVTNEYILNFDVRKSDNALLKSLQVSDSLLSDFDSNIFDYTITFPISTDTLDLPKPEDVTYEKSFDGQNVAVSQSNPAELVITVIAEDGVTIQVYVVHFEILKSSNCLLADILIDGVALEGFSPTQNEYKYLLFPGALLPTLEGVKAEESQEIFVTMGTVGEISYIYVVAEDGTENEYRVTFETSDINPGERPSMDDVAWTPLGDGNFQASTIRKNVQVMIYTVSGLRVRQEAVGLVDPNDNIKQPHDGGTILHFDKKGQTYIYVFVYENKVIFSDKFIY